MTLLEEAMESFVLMDKSTQRDDYGGVIINWTDGAEFDGAIADMSASEIMAAQQLESRASYKLFTEKAITLMYGDIIRRVSDGTYYRVTIEGVDKHTPESAHIDARTVSIERLPALP